MTKTITARQAAVLEFISSYIRRTGLPPTRAEIAVHFDVNINAVKNQLHSLERKGAVRLHQHTARGITINPSHTSHMEHIKLLERCHAYLRGAEINTVDGVKPVEHDKLARDINLYLNNVSTHAQGCWSWGPQHYMCAYERIKQLEQQLAEKSLG